MTNEEIYRRAVELYDETGPSAVYDFADTLGLPYSECEPCDTDTPTIDEQTCLVCGSEKKTTKIW